MPFRFALPIAEKPNQATDAQAGRNYDLIGDPYLWTTAYGSKSRDVPEHNLLCAILVQAWNDLHWPHRTPPMTALERYTLQSWVNGCYVSGQKFRSQPGYSFDDICDALGLEPKATRKALFTTKPLPQNQINRAVLTDTLSIESLLKRRGFGRKRDGRAKN